MNMYVLVLSSLWIVPTVLILYNLRTWKTRWTATASSGEVSVLVPARNEEKNISGLIESVLGTGNSAHVSELIVYDDWSGDRTAQIVGQWHQKDQRVRLLPATELSCDWVGKPYACQQLLHASKSRFVLFLDADVRLHAGGLEQLLSIMAQPESPTLATAVPRQITGTTLEHMIVPLLHLTYLSWLPLRWANRRLDPHTVAACGQVMLAEREKLLRLGGFSAVSHEVVDDVALCRHARSRGQTVHFVDGVNLASCRMYRSAAEVWSGFSKNLYLGLGSPLAFIMATGLYFCAFVLPYVTFLSGLWLAFPALFLRIVPGQIDHLPGLILGGVGILANVGIRALLARRYRHPLSSVWLHPLSVVLLLLIALNSLLWVLRGRIRWSGRTYSPARKQGFAR